MIRTSAVLTVVAMAMLVAGASSASLGLVYASIAVSILAAVTLGAGVLLRRRELFGAADAGDARRDWPAADAARSPALLPPGTEPAGQTGAGRGAADRARAGRGGTGGDGAAEDDRLAERPRNSTAGTSQGSGRWPGAIAAKDGPPAARRVGGRAAGRERSAKPAAGGGPPPRDQGSRAPAPREPARGDWARTDRDRAVRPNGDREQSGRPWGDREPAPREPAAYDRDREPAGHGPAARDLARREPAERERAGSGGERGRAWPGQDREQAAARADNKQTAARADNKQTAARADHEQAAARADREAAGRGRDHDSDRDEATPAGRGHAGTEQEPAARADRGAAARGRDQATAGRHPGAFRLPAPDERAAGARGEPVPHEERGGPAAGDEFWDRVSEELGDSGSRGPARPAWPATAGPRAMGQAGPAQWNRGEASLPQGRRDQDDRDEGQAAADDGSRWRRMVPPYVDDLSGPRRDREPPGAGREAGPAGERDAAASTDTAGQDEGSGWSAWSAVRVSRTEEPAASRTSPGGPPEDEDGEDRQDEIAALAPAPGRAGSAVAGREPGGGSSGDDDAARDAAAVPAETDVELALAGEAAAADEAGRAGTHGTGEREDGAALPAGAAAADGPAGDGPAAAAGPPGVDDSGADGASATRAKGTGEARGAGETRSRAPGDDEASGAPAGGGAEDAEAAGDAARRPLDDEMTVVPGVPRYHRRGCILIRFLSDGDLEITTRRQAEASGLVPCKACQPDKPETAA